MIGPANIGPYHLARFKAATKLLNQFTYVRISTKEYFRPWSSNLDIGPCRVINLEHQNRISKFLDREQPDIIPDYAYMAISSFRKSNLIS